MNEQTSFPDSNSPQLDVLSAASDQTSAHTGIDAAPAGPTGTAGSVGLDDAPTPDAAPTAAEPTDGGDEPLAPKASRPVKLPRKAEKAVAAVNDALADLAGVVKANSDEIERLKEDDRKYQQLKRMLS